MARRLLGYCLFVVVLVLGWRFAAHNSAPVTIDYLVGELGGVALWGVLLAAFVAGAVVAGAFGLYHVTRLQLVARRYRKTVHGLESEVHQLRNLPLSADAPPMGGPASGEALGRGP